MTPLLLAFLSWFGAFFRSWHDLRLELAALRQQRGVLKRKNPRPQVEPVGSSVLADAAQVVIKTGEGLGDSEAGDRRRLASRRIPLIPASFSRKRPGRSKITPRSFGNSSGPWQRRIRPAGCEDPRLSFEIGVRGF
jgi:hypothetical protein